MGTARVKSTNKWALHSTKKCVTKWALKVDAQALPREREREKEGEREGEIKRNIDQDPNQDPDTDTDTDTGHTDTDTDRERDGCLLVLLEQPLHQTDTHPLHTHSEHTSDKTASLRMMM